MSDPTSSLILRADTGGIATLTLNRPAQFNAISVAMLVEMQRALDVIAADKSVRIVVIAGAGQAFSPGHISRKCLPTRTRHSLAICSGAAATSC